MLCCIMSYSDPKGLYFKTTLAFSIHWRSPNSSHSIGYFFLNVGAFSGRIGLPPAVMGWATSCDDGP